VIALADAAPQSWDAAGVVVGLVGGMALFLLGLEYLSAALKASAGERMKAVVGALTSNRFASLGLGFVVTTVLQSSSVTTVMLFGFVSLSLVSLPHAIGIILGGGIGGTVAAQIIAFPIAKYSPLILAVGFFVAQTARREALRYEGRAVLGFGLIFFGLGAMSSAVHPLSTYEPVVRLLQHVSNPLLGILVGAALTALFQSSSATMGVAIVLASAGLIDLPGGIALALGANVGSCTTPVLAAVGKPREVVRVAAAHVLYKVTGALVVLPLIPYVAEAAARLSPASLPRQIANAHTGIMIGLALLALPVTGQIARFVEWLLPDRPPERGSGSSPLYLDESLFTAPAMAIDRARLEIGRVGAAVRRMLVAVLPACVSGTTEELDRVSRMDDEIDSLHGDIVAYLGKLSLRAINERQTREVITLLNVVNDLENIGDILETNLVSLGQRRLERGVVVSEPTREVISEFHTMVVEAFDAAMQAVRDGDGEAARRVVDVKERINEKAHSAALHEANRLVAEAPNRVATYAVETNIVENLKRVYYFTKRIARAVAPAEVGDVAAD
jgi:phosphate:Na+ symporter